jgi:hypothetical protein
MKKIFFISVIILISQNAFAEPWDKQEKDFIDAFERSDLVAMEKALKEKTSNTNLEALLYTVIMKQDHDNGPTAVRLLIKYGVKLNSTTPYCYSLNRIETTLSLLPLRFAIIYGGGNIQIIKILLEAGASVNPPGDLAAYNLFPKRDSYLPLARVLIEHGFNVNNDDGYPTFLQRSAEDGQIGLVKLLVESGAKVNHMQSEGYLKGKTAAQIAYESNEIDIYNYLKQNGATWTAPSQVASTPQPSAQPRQTYDSYDYSPPPSSSRSSSSSSGSSWADVGKAITEAFTPPLESGTYGISGTQLKISIAGIAKSGMLFFTNRQGKQVRGTYNIDGNTMTIQADGYTYVYTITSKTSFSGHGETWVRTGY